MPGGPLDGAPAPAPLIFIVQEWWLRKFLLLLFLVYGIPTVQLSISAIYKWLWCWVVFEMKCTTFSFTANSRAPSLHCKLDRKKREEISKVLISITTRLCQGSFSLLESSIFWGAPSTLRGWITQSAHHPTDKFCRSVSTKNRTIRENSETNYNFYKQSHPQQNN